jgi:hypothetical protein
VFEGFKAIGYTSYRACIEKLDMIFVINKIYT